jgi:inorganic pyrophosphatase
VTHRAGPSAVDLGSPTILCREGAAPLVRVTIEIPRGSVFKRGSNGALDFISPLPCPYNYGSVPGWLGLEGDLLDAVVLGPRLPRGASVQVRAYGAVGLEDRGRYDDKLICAQAPPSAAERNRILAFFRWYGRCKAVLNLLRGQWGRTRSVGWGTAESAIARARPLSPGTRQDPEVRF